MGFSKNTQATRSTLMSVDSTLSENITAAQDYIPIASTTNFSTSVVAEIETTNEVVSFDSITENFAFDSENFGGSYTRTAVTVTANSTTAPDGTTSADTIIPTVSNTLHYISQRQSVIGSVSAKVTTSVYLKAAGYNFAKLYSQASGTCSANFNLSTGTVGTTGGSAFNSARITDVGDGWYRCEITNDNSITSGTIGGFYVTSVASSPVTSGYSEAGDGTSGAYAWGFQIENANVANGYLPTTSAKLQGLTTVTRGVNGTTATLATSGDAIQQLPYALSEVNMPSRLKAISVSSDGTGAGRFTLCDKVGTTLLDIDFPDGSSYELDFGDDRGIIFPNGIYVSNSDNITAYTLFTDKHSGAGL